MKKQQAMDTLMYEGDIQNSLSLMSEAMNLLKKAIIEGTQMQDKLMLSQQNTVDIEDVKKVVNNLHISARNARHIYGEARETFDGINLKIEEQFARFGNIDTRQYQLLKKLRQQITNAKITLRGYSINKMEETAYKTVEAINKATKQHYRYRSR